MGDTKKRVTLKSFRSCKFDSLKYYGYCIMMLNSPMQNRKLGVRTFICQCDICQYMYTYILFTFRCVFFLINYFVGKRKKKIRIATFVI